MPQYHDDPAQYLAAMRAAVPRYDELQDAVAAAAARARPRRLLDLGTGTGETASRVVAAVPGAEVTGIDASERMLAMARRALPSARLLHQPLEAPLPPGPFDLVTAAFAVHHLDSAGKQDLFHRVRDVLAPGGRLVVADVVRLDDPATAITPVDPTVDHPDRLDDQLEGLRRAAFEHVSAPWRHGDLAVFTATTPTELLHVVPAGEHDPGAAEHRPAAYAADGFVHLCTRAQLAGVLERYYAGRDDVLVLTLDARALGDVRWEPGAGADPGPFPHLYGPVPAAAVRSVDQPTSGGGTSPGSRSSS
jgi:tRNA (cmo5U34)-methyltransferase